MSIERKPTRRNILGELGAVAATGAAAYGAIELLNHPKPQAEEASTPNPERPFLTTVELGDLAGKRDGGLAKWYLHSKADHFPKSIETSFVANLARMWEAKLDNSAGKSSELALAFVRDFGTRRAEEYAELWKRGPEAVGVWQPPEGIGAHPHFSHMVSEFSKIETEIVDKLDWGGLAKAYGFTEAWDINMLAALASRAQGRSLAAYSMTEIMPYGGGEAAENIALYDLLLREAGPEFIARIPALYDGLISYGPFQFTKHAIENGIAAPEHALAVNKFLPEELQVPGHISDFTPSKGDPLKSHATAAFLFGLQNVAIASSELIARGHSASLDAIADMDGSTFASVLAMHHYRPALAKEALMDWAKQAERGEGKESLHTFARRLDPDVDIYGERSKRNYEVIEQHFNAIQ